MSSNFSKRDNYLRLAGFFEGEGCIMVSHQYSGKGYFLRVSVGQLIRNEHHHKFLELFREYFGGIPRIRKKPTKGGKKISYYQVNGFRAVKLLETLLPYLEEKRDRAELAIRLGKIKLNNNGKDFLKRLEKKKLAEEITRLNHLVV